MPHPLLNFSQSDYLIQIVDINSYTEWQTVQNQISWLLKKPTDLDLHCLQRQSISGFSRTSIQPLSLILIQFQLYMIVRSRWDHCQWIKTDNTYTNEGPATNEHQSKRKPLITSTTRPKQMAGNLPNVLSPLK